MKLKKPLKISFFVVAAIVIFFAGFAGSTALDKRGPILGSNTKIDARTIEESIKEISEIVTLSYCYTDIGEYSDQRTLNLFGADVSLPFGKKSFIISYDGEMKLGVNMAQASVEVNAVSKRITVAMPPAQIIAHVISEDTVKLFDEKSGLFNKISITDYTGFMSERKPLAEEKAEASGLLTQALDNAQTQLKALLLSIPGVAEEYEVRFAAA